MIMNILSVVFLIFIQYSIPCAILSDMLPHSDNMFTIIKKHITKTVLTAIIVIFNVILYFNHYIHYNYDVYLLLSFILPPITVYYIWKHTLLKNLFDRYKKIEFTIKQELPLVYSYLSSNNNNSIDNDKTPLDILFITSKKIILGCFNDVIEIVRILDEKEWIFKRSNYMKKKYAEVSKKLWLYKYYTKLYIKSDVSNGSLELSLTDEPEDENTQYNLKNYYLFIDKEDVNQKS